MARKKPGKAGYGKLLDAWTPPDHAGDPIGCVATSFTFSPVFFEEECLSRFLRLQTDATEDGAAYLIEREEKLAQVRCAVALVDQHHCRGIRSLRWDLVPIRLHGSILHAKVSLLCWSRLVRVIVASANITEDGYRRNLEVFGVLDYRPGSTAPLGVLRELVSFLRELLDYAHTGDATDAPALRRCESLLAGVLEAAKDWGNEEGNPSTDQVRVQAVFSGPKRRSVLATLSESWPVDSPPHRARIVSPFFDPPDALNRPAQEIWKVLKMRGEATVCYHVTAEEIAGEKAILLHAPRSLAEAEPTGRSGVATKFFRVVTEAHRPLHAKGIWLEGKGWACYTIGSSNFTTRGLGLVEKANFEANLAYWIRVRDSKADREVYRALRAGFIPYQDIDPELETRWQPRTDIADDEADADCITLPAAFDQAVFDVDECGCGFVILTFAATPPSGWTLCPDEEEEVFLDEATWQAQGAKLTTRVSWPGHRPPSGFTVRWHNSGGAAWWPVVVARAEVLPPPAELRDLPLEVLIDVLTSARPLHQAMQGWLRRQKDKEGGMARVELDPHRRVDTSAFLLQRTRRVSWALRALRERLSRPVPTAECLQWRLWGPVGAKALAKALLREKRSDQEKAFLLTELALELSRVQPRREPGCLEPETVKQEVRRLIEELQHEVRATSLQGLPDLQAYIDEAFREALA
ncbi:MAG: hypothetical protein KatS3mg110_1116 [Pirellulaceae bacterium]|nr:MAG: hypothetical protein KatS3mg110_1116 [Pirellulaceae bacterium]